MAVGAVVAATVSEDAGVVVVWVAEPVAASFEKLDLGIEPFGAVGGPPAGKVVVAPLGLPVDQGPHA